jgi:regulatory protein
MRTPRVAAMDYLARREHTRVELRRKLQKKGYEQEEIEQALDRLQKEGLQSDLRFAESFTEQRARNGHGPLKIRQELRIHGVGDVMIDDTLNSISVDWDQQALAVWHKKFGRLPLDIKEKAKQQRFMLQRGFEYFNIPETI